MRKLALNDDILLKVEKPARYIGNEVNSVQKNKDKMRHGWLCQGWRYSYTRRHEGQDCRFSHISRIQS